VNAVVSLLHRGESLLGVLGGRWAMLDITLFVGPSEVDRQKDREKRAEEEHAATDELTFVIQGTIRFGIKAENNEPPKTSS
jgi:hypothetical protein